MHLLYTSYPQIFRFLPYQMGFLLILHVDNPSVRMPLLLLKKYSGEFFETNLASRVGKSGIDII